MNKTTGLASSICCISFVVLAFSGCSDDKEKAQKLQENTSTDIKILKEKSPVELIAKPDVSDAVDKSTASVTETINESTQSVSQTITDIEPKRSDTTETVIIDVVEKETPAVNEKASVAPPETHTVKAIVTKFQPMVLFVNPGDTVTWTNMTGHDTAAVEGMVPEGAELWHSKMGDQFSYTFSEKGAYVYKCTPHVSLGMLGAIIVGQGEPANLQQIVEHPDNKGMIGRTVRKMKKALDDR